MNRRTVLRTSAGLGVGALAGCLGSDGDGSEAPEPVSLSGTKYDYQGGMEIGAHGGPNGQIFYEDEEPEPVGGPASFRNTHSGHDDSGDQTANLAWFHTLVFGLFPYHFERLDRGWEAAAVYVTDYSTVEWDVPEDSARPTMPAPTGADTFADATGLYYVGESDVTGGMGPALHPFSEQSEADAFADNYNGTVYEFDDIDRVLIDSLQQQSNMEM
jgi:nitrous oxide reductase accessory protein NosL